MTTTNWHFVLDETGEPLAAFPNRELADSYSEGCGDWTIREHGISLWSPAIPHDQAAAEAWDAQRDAIAQNLTVENGRIVSRE